MRRRRREQNLCEQTEHMKTLTWREGARRGYFGGVGWWGGRRQLSGFLSIRCFCKAFSLSTGIIGQTAASLFEYFNFLSQEHMPSDLVNLNQNASPHFQDRD